jgi:transformation/transcription domain-associated protein
VRSTETIVSLDPFSTKLKVDTIVNFIIRSKILLADPKVESGGTNIEERLEKLLKTMTSRWQRCVIRPIYLEKVVTLCKDENALRATSPTINASKIEEKGRKQASKPKAAKATTTAGAKNDDKKVTSALLSACLDIFVGLAEMAPENSFLTENSYQLSEILISCFFQARQPEEHEVRKKLQQFVVKFLSCSKNKKIDTSVVQLINVQIESFLVDAEIGYRKGSTGSQGSSSDRQQNSTRYRQTALEQERSEVIAASFALGIINEISSSREAYFKTFTSSLLGLLETLVKKHISDASSKQKQGGVSNAPQVGTGSIRQIHHTPTVGILNETFLMNNPQSVSAGARSTQPKEPYPSMELNEFNQTLRSTALIIEMLGTSDLAYSFTRSRKALFQIMSNILDSSNSIQLLLTAVRVVGRWLLSDIAGGPLTSKERYNFLWRIASFDFNGLPDAVAQPLADLVSHYVIAFLSQRGLTIEDQRMPDIVSSMNEYAPSKNMPQIIKENDDAMLGRSMVSCLVTANHPLRDILLSLFVSQTNRPEEEKHSSAAQGGIPLRTPTEVLWQLFHSDFEGLGGRYWIVVFVELLLVNMRSSAHIAGSQEPANKKKTTRLLPMPRFSNSADSSPLLRAKSLSEYQSFVKTVVEEKKGIDSGGEHFVTALRQLAHGDVSICQSLFETLLPASWIVIPNDEIRLGLVLAMESLLSCTFHSQFFKNDVKRTDQRAMNSIRSFLNGLSALKPLPTIDINIMVSLAETYNCWYEVLSILEHQYLVVSNKKLSKAGIEFRDEVILAMQQCYRQLGESNIWMGLALKSCILPDTKRAASLDVYGKVDGALEAYSNLVDLVESGASSPPDVEIRLWEERWVDINREQCQLGAVAEYANASSNSLLMLECAWKMQDWDRVRALCSMPSLVAAVESGEPAVKMSETLLAVADGKLSDVENLHAQTAQLCLYKWQQLPALTSGSNAHAGLLHFFHRLVEIRESGQIMVETSNHSTGKTLPDLKNLLKYVVI